MSGFFKPLEADDIECRVSQVNKDGSVNLLLYKTARVDANVLDDVIGQFSWQCEFREVNGVVYCGIGILEPTSKVWVWKWDAGSESNVEKEKGQASDAFKRAGFKWGIGRELYTAPRIKVSADKSGARDGKCFTPFKVDSIEYDDSGSVSKLIIAHGWTGDILYQFHKMEPKPAQDEWTPRQNARKASQNQVGFLTRLCRNDDREINAICEKYNVRTLSELTMEQANEEISLRTRL